MPLPEGAGTQMLWRNPKGFQTKAGEYVRVKIPWLEVGGDEWHPFSVYLREATHEGLKMVNSKGQTRIYCGDRAKGGEEVHPKKIALLLIKFQNEGCSPSGKLHEKVKKVMESNGMLSKTSNLAEFVRSVGVQVIHAPFIYKQSENPNSELGIMKSMNRSSMYQDNNWASGFVDSHAPRPGDITLSGGYGVDVFVGSNLGDIIVEKGLDTLIICGLLSNVSVESTVRSAYEKGINVITLTDGTACMSLKEQKAAELNWNLFSTPMTCAMAAELLKIHSSLEPSSTIPDEKVTQDIVREVAESTLQDFVRIVLEKPFEADDHHKFIVNAARDDLTKKYQTTQIFVAPAGNWSKGVSSDVALERHGRSCWARGPYTSPYFIATDFSNLILMASGIGITPALGVIGQYPEFSRTKILIWSIRSRNMLKFYTPLMSDAHLAVVFYTGKEKLTTAEISSMSTYGNIFIQQSRPKSLAGTIESIIVQFEEHLGFGDKSHHGASAIQIEKKDRARRAAWCVLYCGGSTRIRDELYEYTQKAGTGWECELFDW